MAIPNQIFKPKFVIALICVMFIFVSNAQNTIQITIDTHSEKKAISPYIYGRNNSLSDNSSSPLSASDWKRLKDAGVKMFRECGGNNSTKYNWKRKLTSHPDWYNNVFPHDWNFAANSLQQNIPNAQGMWAFQLIGKAAKSGSSNFSSWNYNNSQWWDGVHQNLCGNGVVNTAGGSNALVEGDPELYLEDWPADSTVKILDHWFNDLSIDSTKVRYWGMDNEAEIWSGTHDDVMPEQLSAEEFMQVYFDVAKKARAKFPGIKLCGPVPANEWQWYNWKNDRIDYNGKKYVWLEYFILRVAEEQMETGIRLLDVLDIHFYPGDTKSEDIVQLHRVYFDKTYNYPGANGVKRIGGWDNSITQEYIFGRCEEWLVKYIGANHGVTFGVSETGIKSDNPNITASWYASTIGEFAKQGVDFFTPWGWRTGMWEVLHLFSRYAQNNFVESISGNEEFVSAYPTINENADSMTLFLVNRHLSETKELEIDINNFAIKNESIQMLTLSDLPGSETFSTHTNNALKSTVLEKPSYNLKVNLEPLSVNAVILHAAPTKNSSLSETEFQFKTFPNPSSGELNIEFSLEMKSRVKVDLFSINGQILKTICSTEFLSGRHKMNTNLSALSAGVYWIKIQTENSTQTKKLILN